MPSTFIEECNSLINNCGSEVIGYKQLFVSEFDFNVMSPCEYLRNIESLLGREPSDGIYLYSRRLIGTGRYEEDIPVMGMEDYFFRKKVLAKKPKIGYTRTPLLHYHDSTFRWFIRRSYNYGTTFRRTIRIDFRKSSAVNDYLIFTKSQTDSKIKLPFKPIALLFPFFLLLKYAAFGLGFLIS
ncbi:MAG: hypothetical protein JRN20_20160, partial [Nitrososphaerota archaeon]|nr:hypothetical protein [Nitrososphaerota archaeon]